MSRHFGDESQMLDPEIVAAEPSSGIDRRTRSRSAMIGAVAVLAGAKPATAGTVIGGLGAGDTARHQVRPTSRW
jgi:hypothetical protein